MADGTGDWSNEIVFYVNGKRVVARDAQPDEFLIHYLRNSRLCSTHSPLCSRSIFTQLLCFSPIHFQKHSPPDWH